MLGLRASAYLMPYMPEKYRLLPLLQSVWYIGAGLDIWNQLLCKYPGRYATMKGMQVPPPELRPGRLAGGPAADPRAGNASRSGCTPI